MLALRKGRLKRVSEYGAARLAVRNLGSECRCCSGSCQWPCAYAEGLGREMVPASFFVAGEVSL